MLNIIVIFTLIIVNNKFVYNIFETINEYKTINTGYMENVVTIRAAVDCILNVI